MKQNDKWFLDKYIRVIGIIAVVVFLYVATNREDWEEMQYLPPTLMVPVFTR